MCSRALRIAHTPPSAWGESGAEQPAERSEAESPAFRSRRRAQRSPGHAAADRHRLPKPSPVAQCRRSSWVRPSTGLRCRARRRPQSPDSPTCRRSGSARSSLRKASSLVPISVSPCSSSVHAETPHKARRFGTERNTALPRSYGTCGSPRPDQVDVAVAERAAESRHRLEVGFDDAGQVGKRRRMSRGRVKQHPYALAAPVPSQPQLSGVAGTGARSLVVVAIRDRGQTDRGHRVVRSLHRHDVSQGAPVVLLGAAVVRAVSAADGGGRRGSATLATSITALLARAVAPGGSRRARPSENGGPAHRHEQDEGRDGTGSTADRPVARTTIAAALKARHRQADQQKALAGQPLAPREIIRRP